MKAEGVFLFITFDGLWDVMRCLKDHHTVEKTVCPILVVASFYEHIGKQIIWGIPAFCCQGQSGDHSFGWYLVTLSSRLSGLGMCLRHVYVARFTEPIIGYIKGTIIHNGSWGNIYLMIMPSIISGNLTGHLNANTIFTRCLWYTHAQRNLFWLRDKTKIESVFRFWWLNYVADDCFYVLQPVKWWSPI